MTFLRIFPREVKDIILREVRFNPRKVRLKQTSKNLENSKSSKFLFGWRGHLMIIFDQFTFFRYSTAWTISKHSSGTIIDKICKHS